ncbi:phage terminase large subunit family protein [Halocalculus aciditolerans]|uniref:Terminase large subunit gp17-like C-terminal domain-containing protein n=1 Tax=Halocalculus aciditolerans TaxID=1383812 RepID=A0A830FI53_9EURY|nr:hypothetical protein [Halocalculus aciditolerans]GGL55076.1 hypothetical protein GCM10009039_11460 [Halocalculus aciditolerans]
MASTGDVESGAAMRRAKRDVLNPIENPDRWMDFANEVTRGYMGAELDDYHLLGDHHRQWIEDFQADEDLVLMCHRDGLKTTINIVVLIAHLEYQPGFRAHWIANNQEQAYKKADEELSNFIERNPWLVELNKPMEKDSKTSKTWANGSKLNAGWLFGGIEGDRSHLLVLDDVIKEHGDGDTDRILDWIEGVTVPMVKDGGHTVIIGTRKRPDDIYAHFRSQEGYAVREYPAVLDVWDQEFREDADWEARRPDPGLYSEVDDPWHEGETMQVLWPDARGPEWLADKRTKMSDHRFWREYSLVLRGAAGDLLDASAVNRLVDDGGCSIRGRQPPREYTAGAGEAVIVAHDPAASKTGDRAAFVTELVRRDGRRVPLDVQYGKGLQPSDVKATLTDLDERYDPAMVVIESNGMQTYVANDAIEFSASLRGKVRGMSTSGQKHSWENGIPRLQTLVENGGILFHRGDDGVEDLIQAMLSLKMEDNKLKGHTPDLVAAWYMAEKGIQALEKAGVLDETDPGADGDDDTHRDANTGLGINTL